AAAGGAPDRAVAELRAGQPERARAILARDLRLAPDNGYLHLLNALSYDLQPGSPEASELASVGYQSAARLAPGYYWAHYLDGTAALRRQLNARAAEEF